MPSEITGAESLLGEEPARFDAFLATPTACTRDAPVHGADHPLVLYHSGAGSSFEDDAVLCEFLASHGYVVIGSAFQTASAVGVSRSSAASVTGPTVIVIRRIVRYPPARNLAIFFSIAASNASKPPRLSTPA